MECISVLCLTLCISLRNRECKNFLDYDNFQLFCRIAFYFILSGIKKITKHFCGFIDVSFLCINNSKITKENLLDSIGMDYFGHDAIESIVRY